MFPRIKIALPPKKLESPEGNYVHRDPIYGPPRHDLRKPFEMSEKDIAHGEVPGPEDGGKPDSFWNR
jgi:hypothetical protein